MLLKSQFNTIIFLIILLQNKLLLKFSNLKKKLQDCVHTQPINSNKINKENHQYNDKQSVK